jgi:hypothetical protein
MSRPGLSSRRRASSPRTESATNALMNARDASASHLVAGRHGLNYLQTVYGLQPTSGQRRSLHLGAARAAAWAPSAPLQRSCRCPGNPLLAASEQQMSSASESAAGQGRVRGPGLGPCRSQEKALSLTLQQTKQPRHPMAMRHRPRPQVRHHHQRKPGWSTRARRLVRHDEPSSRLGQVLGRHEQPGLQQQQLRR